MKFFTRQIRKLLILLIFTVSVSACGDTSKLEAKPNAPLVKWSEDITLEQIVTQSQDNFKKWYTTVGKENYSSQSLEVFVQPGIDAELQDKLFAPLQDEISTLGNFGPKKYTIFASKNKKWIIDKARELKGNYKNQNNPCGVEDSSNNLEGCAEGNVIYLLIHDEQNIKGDPHPLAVVAHEYFHLVQDSLLISNPNTRDDKSVPAWLIEGSADWIGLTFYHNHYGINYVDARSAYSQLGVPTAVSNKLSDYLINDKNFLYPYTIGRSAVELIVAFSGMEGLLNIFKLTGETGNFAAAFETSTGISLTSFYDYFEKVRSKIGISEVFKHVVCGENIAIDQVGGNCAKTSNSNPKNNQNHIPTTRLEDASEGQSCSGHTGVITTTAAGEKLLCKVESDGNTHWIKAP